MINTINISNDKNKNTNNKLNNNSNILGLSSINPIGIAIYSSNYYIKNNFTINVTLLDNNKNNIKDI